MINNNWKFYKGRNENAYLNNFDDSLWEEINIPHTWNNIDGQDGTKNGGKDIKITDYFRGDGWYRKWINFSDEDKEKQIYLRFQGANIQTEIYINGIKAGEHKGGYTAFAVNITPFVNFNDKNLIAVKVNNEFTEEIAPLTADFTFYGGIYREIELIKKNPVHFDFGEFSTRGIKITTPQVSDDTAQCTVNAIIENNSNCDQTVYITAELEENNDVLTNPYISKTDFEKNENFKSDFQITDSQKITVKTNSKQSVEFNFNIENPHLWNGRKDPFLYKVTLNAVTDNEIIDSVSDCFGLRYFEITKNGGFFLNGKSYPLRGVSRHQDREGLGNAISINEHNEDFALIYDMGVNSLRLAHYPQAEYFYRLCDYYGIVVWAEIPVVDLIGGNGDYNNPDKKRAEFFASTKQQLREMINQNYNRPSIICWGIQNEIQAKFDNIMPQFTEELHETAKHEDKFRYTTQATNHRAALTWKSDLIAWNVYPGWYGMSRKQLGWFLDKNRDFGRPTGISEYGAGGNLSQHKLKPRKPKHDGQWHPVEYQSLCHEAFINAINERPYLWCTYVWNMFDFGSDGRNEGGRPGMNDKGLVSFDRKIKKDSYYLYQAYWSKNAMIHITSKAIDTRKRKTFIKIYSNCKCVSLYINDKLYREIKAEQNKQDCIFIFKSVKLQKGTNKIKAVGFSNNSQYTDSAFFTV